MKKFEITLNLIGLTGPYQSKFIVKARNEESAKNKGYAVVGNRSLESIHIKPLKIS